MATLTAPQADDIGPSAVLASAGQQVIVLSTTPLPAPPDTISPDYGLQVPQGHMSFA